jgi:flagellar biosynthetic protein FliP
MRRQIGIVKGRMTRAFARHYAEMAIVMLVGMAVLAIPARWASGAMLPWLDADDPGLMIARMALIMTLPMVLWMRWRGHRSAPCLEMALAMIAPAVGVILLQRAGLVEGLSLLMTLEHVAMFAAMFVAMVARPDEYCHGRDLNRARPELVASQR